MSKNDITNKEVVINKLYHLGMSFLAQGKYKEGQIIFNGLMVLVPDRLPIALAYGEALLMNNMLDDALKHYVYLLKRFDMDGQILLGAAKGYVLLNRQDEAKALVQPIVEGDVSVSPPDLFVAQAIFSGE